MWPPSLVGDCYKLEVNVATLTCWGLLQVGGECGHPHLLGIVTSWR